jgi:hypothetical protein
MSYRNNFCCRLDPAVLEAMRAKSKDDGQSLGSIASTLLAAALGPDYIAQAMRRLNEGLAVTHPGKQPARPAPFVFPDYENLPMGASR